MNHSPAETAAFRPSARCFGLLLVPFLTTCGSDPSGAGVTVPEGLAAAAGDDQVATVGIAVATPPSVVVRDARGDPAVGIEVTFAVTSGDGSVAGASPITDAEGIAAVASWTVGTEAGPNSLTAAVEGLAAVTFTATGVADAPVQLSLTAQPSTTFEGGGAFPAQPVVQLRDQHGNPAGAAGVEVTVAIASGGNGLGGTTTVATDSDGRAVFTDLLIWGPIGAHTLEFTAEGLLPARSDVITILSQVNAPPTMDPIDDRRVAEDSPERTITLTGITPGPAHESDQDLTIDVSTNNPDLFANLSVEPTAIAAGGAGQALLRFTPAANAVGTAAVQVIVRDNGRSQELVGGEPVAFDDPRTTAATFALQVWEVNAAPVAMDVDLLADHGLVLTGSQWSSIGTDLLAFNDSPGPPNESGQTLTVTAVDAASAAGAAVVLDLETAEVIYTRPTGFWGEDSFTYTVTDDGTTDGNPDPRSATATVSFVVLAVNSSPRYDRINELRIPEDSPEQTITITGIAPGPPSESGQDVTIEVSTNRPALFASLSVDPTVIAASATDQALLRVTPAANRYGAALVTVTVTDNGQSEALVDGEIVAFDDPRLIWRMFILAIWEVNDPPVAGDVDLLADHGLVIPPDTPFPIDANLLTGNDSPGPPDESGQRLTVTAVDPVSTAGGTLILDSANEQVIYTPPPGFSGEDSFTYTVTDDGRTDGQSDPRSDTATVTLTVTQSVH